jgi:Zn-dependent peptidase ImmA (M78 family)
VGEIPSALAFALRQARERREVATELVGADEPRWTLSATMSEPPESLAARIRTLLQVSIGEQRARGLAAWRDAVEAAGVLVFGFSGIDSPVASGFALTQGTDMPAIGLNNRDAPVRRVFTLLHELTHVALRTEDVLCDLSDDSPANAETERYCNSVAGAVAVPGDLLLAHGVVAQHRGDEWADGDVQRVARDFGVSREVVLRRLLATGRTTNEHYRKWRARFRADQRDYELRVEGGTGGPPQARTRLAQLGRRYVHLVLSAADRERISLSDASQYLGMKVDQFPKLVAELRGEAA